MKEVRLGVIGVGNMGSGHVGCIEAGKVKELKVAAVCDIDPAKLERFQGKYKTFTDSAKLIRSGEVDAVLVATPRISGLAVGGRRRAFCRTDRQRCYW